jgi:hypothetical protein
VIETFTNIDIAPGFATCCALATSDETRLKPAVDDGSPVARDYSAASDVLIVSFSGLKRNPTKLPGFSLRRTLEGLPLKKLYVRDLDRAWFLRGLRGVTSDVEETVAFLRDEARSSGARRVVLTGYSLGGFGALLYGTLMGADEVQAISPQTFLSFWRRWRAGDHRWQRYVLPLQFTPTRRYHDLRPFLAGSSSAGRHIHFARDSRLDAIHAEHVRGFGKVVLHEYPQGAHRLITDLCDSGALRQILWRAATGESLQPGAGKI